MTSATDAFEEHAAYEGDSIAACFAHLPEAAPGSPAEIRITYDQLRQIACCGENRHQCAKNLAVYLANREHGAREDGAPIKLPRKQMREWGIGDAAVISALITLQHHHWLRYADPTPDYVAVRLLAAPSRADYQGCTWLRNHHRLPQAGVLNAG